MSSLLRRRFAHLCLNHLEDKLQFGRSLINKVKRQFNSRPKPREGLQFLNRKSYPNNQGNHTVSKCGILSNYVRNELHWLPTRRRTEFKILMVMYNCLVRPYLRYLWHCIPAPSLSDHKVISLFPVAYSHNATRNLYRGGSIILELASMPSTI